MFECQHCCSPKYVIIITIIGTMIIIILIINYYYYCCCYGWIVISLDRVKLRGQWWQSIKII